MWGVQPCVIPLHAHFRLGYSALLVAPCSDLNDVNRLAQSGFCNIGDLDDIGIYIAINFSILSYDIYKHIAQPYMEGGVERVGG